MSYAKIQNQNPIFNFPPIIEKRKKDIRIAMIACIAIGTLRASDQKSLESLKTFIKSV
jgi:hypothetical protein